MGFHINTRDQAHEESAPVGRLRTSASGSFGIGPWSAAASVSFAYVSSTKADSNAELNTQTDLTGEVEIHFQSDYFPIERFADSAGIDKIRANTPVPATNTPTSQIPWGDTSGRKPRSLRPVRQPSSPAATPSPAPAPATPANARRRRRNPHAAPAPAKPDAAKKPDATAKPDPTPTAGRGSAGRTTRNASGAGRRHDQDRGTGQPAGAGQPAATGAGAREREEGEPVTAHIAPATASESLPGPYAKTPAPDGLDVSPAVLALARAQVRTLLESSPAFRELPQDRRRQLAYDLVKVAAYTAALLQEEFALTEQLDQVPCSSARRSRRWPRRPRPPAHSARSRSRRRDRASRLNRRPPTSSAPAQRARSPG